MDNIPLPKHEVLSEDDKQKVFELYKVSPDELPRIMKGDPGLQDLTVTTGDVIKITRKSPTAGDSVYYRIVVD